MTDKYFSYSILNNYTEWSKFNKEDFILDYFDKNWSEILQLDQHNVNLSMDSYLDHMNAILDIHATYTKVSKYKLKFKLKPWITLALQKSISVKNSLLKKFITCNDSQTKQHLHTRYKEHRNLLSTLWKGVKQIIIITILILIGTILIILGKDFFLIGIHSMQG